MTEKPNTEISNDVECGEIQGRNKKKGTPALWLGGGKRNMEMGGGRGPRTLEDFELVSWFFSRDGH